MKSWGDVMFHMLLVFYCIFGADLIDKHLFDHKLSGIYYGVLMALVFISSYPLFGWKRTAPLKRVGQWSLQKWILFGVVVGAAAIVVDMLSSKIVSQFTT